MTVSSVPHYVQESLWPRGCVCSAAVCLAAAAAAKDFGPAQIWKQLLVLSFRADNHLTRGSLWTLSLQLESVKETESLQRIFDPDSRYENSPVWAHHVWWTGTTGILFLFIINMKSTKICLCFLREKGVDIDSLSLLFISSLLRPPACQTEIDFSSASWRLSQSPKCIWRTEERRGGAEEQRVFCCLQSISTKNCLIKKKVVRLSAGTTNHRVGENHLKLYSALCCCCSDSVPHRLLKSELKVNKTGSSCA